LTFTHADVHGDNNASRTDLNVGFLAEQSRSSGPCHVAVTYCAGDFQRFNLLVFIHWPYEVAARFAVVLRQPIAIFFNQRETVSMSLFSEIDVPLRG
jgi:hypothetical protein